MISLSVAIFGAALLLVATALFQGIKHFQQASFDTALYNHAVDVSNAVDTTLLGNLIVRRERWIEDNKVFPFALGQALVQFRTINGEVVLSSREAVRARLPWNTAVAQGAAQSGGGFFETIKLAGDSYRIVYYRLSTQSLVPLPPLILQIAVPLTILERERGQILFLFWTLIPLALLAAAYAGYMTSKKAFEPVDRIIASARGIEGHQISARVPVPRETELRELATTLNELLGRLEVAFLSQEQFIADASHQLRTPLAIIRGEIDVFLRMPRSSEETARLLSSVGQEIDSLSKLVDELLLLARFDGAGATPGLGRVQLDEIVLGAVSQLAKWAAEKGVEIQFNSGSSEDEAERFEAQGDAELLHILFFNLIENAIKYSPSGAKIDVTLKGGGHDYVVEVKDQGPGLRPEELSRVFDRFYRGFTDQTGQPGAGLGLSIAQRIARIHDAEIEAGNNDDKGATFRVRMKRFSYGVQPAFTRV